VLKNSRATTPRVTWSLLRDAVALRTIPSKHHNGTGLVRISAGDGRNLAKFMLRPEENSNESGVLLEEFDDERSLAELLADQFTTALIRAYVGQSHRRNCKVIGKYTWAPLLSIAVVQQNVIRDEPVSSPPRVL
jgi:hypothetical protein